MNAVQGILREAAAAGNTAGPDHSRGVVLQYLGELTTARRAYEAALDLERPQGCLGRSASS